MNKKVTRLLMRQRMPAVMMTHFDCIFLRQSAS